MKTTRILKSERLKIAYFPIPKCACTSLKNILYYLEFQEKFPQKVEKIHRFWGQKKEEINSELLTEYFKFVVIRDPIKRFLSCYRNRIVYHKDLSKDKDRNVEQFRKFGLPKYPKLNFFVKHLEKYIMLSKNTKHHFDPQSQLLINDLNFYDFVCPIEEMEFLRRKLSEIAGEEVYFPQYQTGGPSITLKNLTKESLSKLIEFYAADYEILKKYYSVDSIHANFKEMNKSSFLSFLKLFN